MAQDAYSLIELQDTTALYDALGYSTRLKVIPSRDHIVNYTVYAYSIVVWTILCITWPLVQPAGVVVLLSL